MLFAAASTWIPQSPLVTFTILLLASVWIPPLFERLKLPGLVGLLVAGVVLGPHGLRLLDPQVETVSLLSEIGKIYLMFVAGLEIDLQEFRKTRNRSLGFGLATFAVPLIVGTLVGRIFGFGWNPAVLIGSLFASHTLLGYPIVQRLGVTRSESVMVTVGATIFTDISALLVLAICVSIQAGEFSWLNLTLQIGTLAIYAAVVLFGFDWAGKIYFRRTGDEEGNQFLFILLAVFLAAVGAQLIHTENIVGAFLAGLAVNDVLGKGPVKEKVEFVGGVLFIPFFFIAMGLIIDLPKFLSTLTVDLPMVLAVVLGLILSKFLAAQIIQRIYRYSWAETMVMWSLSLPQVAATLAAALVGLQAGLLTESLFNSVIVLMLITSILGPLLTQHFASRLLATAPAWASVPPSGASDLFPREADTLATPFTVLIPVSNPQTEVNLIEIGALIAKHHQGQIVPLVIVQAPIYMDEPALPAMLTHSQRLLDNAGRISAQLQVPTYPVLRIDGDIAPGISRTARERNAQMIVMGYVDPNTLKAKLFGNLIDQVFAAAHCPVAVVRLQQPTQTLRQILVPLRNLMEPALQVVQFAQWLADTLDASITVLHVCTPQTPLEQRQLFQSQLQLALQQRCPDYSFKTKLVPHPDPAQAILKLANHFDLTILRSTRRRTAVGLSISDVTTTVIQRFEGSFLLFGEPYA
jgi:Kef-type K+ transport system membrane component KefB/nucleotide-binding universal stress UspA family protein